MKYLHYYDTKTAHDAIYNGNAYEEPWVAYVKDDKSVIYNKRSMLLELAANDTSMYDNETLIVIDSTESDTVTRKMCLLTQPIDDTQRANYIGKTIATNSKVDCAAAVTCFTLGTVIVPKDATYILVTDTLTMHDFGTREFTNGGTITVEATSGKNGLPSPYYIYDLATNIRYLVQFTLSDTFTLSGFPSVAITPEQIDMEYLPAKGKVYKVDIKTVLHASLILTGDATLNVSFSGERGIVTNPANDFTDMVLFEAAPITAFYTIVSRTGDGTHDQTITATSTPLMTQNLVHQSKEVWDSSGFDPIKNRYTSCSMTLIMDGVEVDTHTFNVGENVFGDGATVVYTYNSGGIRHSASGWTCFAEIDEW